MKSNISKSTFFLIFISIFSLVLILGIGFVGFDPYDTGEGEEYIVSNDLIKNFGFESFDGNPVSISGQTNDGKLQFESQASWNIYPDDIQLVNIYTEGDNAYIRYKVAMTSKINMYTTIDVYQCAENNQLLPVEDKFLVAHYRHSGLCGDHMYSWKEYLYWNHYDFGNIKQWNAENNDFGGDLVMSFDIAQNLLPNFQTQSGDSLTKNFDYIAISSVAVKSNIHGKLDDSVPSIVGITPREYEEELSIRSALDVADFPSTDKFDAYYDPDIDLITDKEPFNSFDGGIMPQSAGSSMNPRGKDGSRIWNPELEQSSMTDCRFIYNIGSLSPLVTEYYGTLSYTYIYYESRDYWKILFLKIGVKEEQNDQFDKSYTKPVALHCTNRYIQTEVRVVFDIFCSYKIDVGADGIEDYELDVPMEYYDLLLWLTTVDGFGGGETHRTEYGGIFGDFDIMVVILIIVIIVGTIIVYIFVINPILRARRQRRMIETALRGRK